MNTVEERAPVSEALYHAKGNPPLDKPVTFGGPHLCGSCRRITDTAPAGKVLTSQFGSWDDVVQDPEGGRWLCLPCASVYRDPTYRRRTHVVKMDGTVKHLETTTLREYLRAPIPPDVSLIVPLSGKRIIAPRAKWGSLTTDTGTVHWMAAHKRAMEAGIALREWGFPESSLREGSPPHGIIMKMPFSEHGKVRETWRVFDFARNDKIILPLMLFLSRKSK